MGIITTFIKEDDKDKKSFECFVPEAMLPLLDKADVIIIDGTAYHVEASTVTFRTTADNTTCELTVFYMDVPDEVGGSTSLHSAVV